MAGMFKRTVVVTEPKEWIEGIKQAVPRKVAAYDYELIVWGEAGDPDSASNLVDYTIRIMGPKLEKVEGMVEVFVNDLGATLLKDETK